MKLQIYSNKIFIANDAVDFRKSIDSLCALVVEALKENPTEGIYVFYNSARNRVKIIGYHVNGL